MHKCRWILVNRPRELPRRRHRHRPLAAATSHRSEEPSTKCFRSPCSYLVPACFLTSTSTLIPFPPAGLQLIKMEGWGGLYSGLKPSLVGTAASQVCPVCFPNPILNYSSTWTCTLPAILIIIYNSLKSHILWENNVVWWYPGNILLLLPVTEE